MTCATNIAPFSSAAGNAAVLGFEVNFLADERRVGQMRRLTAQHLTRWGFGSLADDAVLAVSELVTNAIRYGGKHPVGLRVTWSAKELLIEVTDGNPAPARPCCATPADENGRGLLLVAELTDSQGISPDGKTTWCAFSICDAPHDNPRGPAPMCAHIPPCPTAEAPDREAAHPLARHPEQGWSLLCNGVVLFEDTGELLPNGQVVCPHRAVTA